MSDSSVDPNNQSHLFFEHEGPVHRSALVGEHLASEYKGMKTVFDLAMTSLEKFARNPCFGTRSRLPDGTWGGYTFNTYEDSGRNAKNLGSALRDLGHQPKDFIGLYSVNRPEWVESMLGCVLQGMTIVPLYDTLGPDAVKFIVNHAELSTVICSGAAFPKLAAAASASPSLKRIICLDALPANARSIVPEHIEIYTYADVLARGAKVPRAPTAPAPTDLFVIMYTSGTTGDPKGVMLTHSNIMAAVSAATVTAELSSQDVHISYLPLAHIFEMIIMLVGLTAGGSTGFWRGDILGLVEDIQALRPTLLVGVPRVFNRIYDKVLAGVADAGKLKQMIFSYAFSSKKAALEQGQTSALWDKIAFKKIHETLGGRVRAIISGSAPLSAEVQQFLRVTTGVIVKQGYGLTETGALLTVQVNSDPNTSGHVGPPVTCCEVKLVDVPEMGYFSKSNPQRGEICVRGNNVFIGYYKAQDKTDEVLTKDGWFHTGDIGEWLPNGALRIIDRKKNIFKLAQGEYVAVEMIETILSRAKYVMQLYVHGDSLKDYLVAIVVPDAETLLPWAKANGLSGDMATLVKHPRVKKLLYDDILATGTASKLAGFQLPRNLYLEPEPWTVDNGNLTPSMKIKRPTIKSKYQEHIDQLYAEPRMDGAVPKAKL